MADLAVFSDSQGRGIAEKIYFLSNKTVIPTGIVLTNANLLEIIINAKKSKHDHVVLIGGTIDSLKETINEIYKNFEEKLESLRAKKFVCLTTIPKRHDLPEDDPMHEQLVLVNHYIAEVAARMKNTKVIDIHCLLPHYHTTHGLHFNRRGKIKVASLVLKEFNKSVGNSLGSKKKRLNKSKTGVSFKTDSIAISKCPLAPVQDPLINPILHNEAQGEGANRSSCSDLMKFHPPKDSVCHLETRQESSQSSVQLRNEQNSTLEGTEFEFNQKDVSIIPDLVESHLKSDPSKEEICTETPETSTAPESKCSMTTSSTIQPCVDNLHRSLETSSLTQMKTFPLTNTKSSHSNRINISFNFRKMKVNHLKEKSKRKCILHKNNMQQTNKKKVKHFRKTSGFVKRQQNQPSVLICKNHSSNNCANGFNLPSPSTTMRERCMNNDEENHQDNSNGKNKEDIVKTVNISKHLFLFETINSFFQCTILGFALYLFLTEFVVELIKTY